MELRNLVFGQKIKELAACIALLCQFRKRLVVGLYISHNLRHGRPFLPSVTLLVFVKNRHSDLDCIRVQVVNMQKQLIVMHLSGRLVVNLFLRGFEHCLQRRDQILYALLDLLVVFVGILFLARLLFTFPS